MKNASKPKNSARVCCISVLPRRLLFLWPREECCLFLVLLVKKSTMTVGHLGESHSCVGNLFLLLLWSWSTYKALNTQLLSTPTPPKLTNRTNIRIIHLYSTFYIMSGLPPRLAIPARLIFQAAAQAKVPAILFGGAAAKLNGSTRDTKVCTVILSIHALRD